MLQDGPGLGNMISLWFLLSFFYNNQITLSISSNRMRHFNFSKWIFFLLCSTVLNAETVDHAFLMGQIEKAYNFDQETFQWFDSEAFDKSNPMQSFIAATASYWIYQADRIEEEKRSEAEASLSLSIDLAERYYKLNKGNSTARFLYGINRCNRARFYVEESSWFRAYLDAREGLGVLKNLVEDDPDFADAYFAIGVAECYLSDAPVILKPLARLLGFSGSVEAGISKLQRCIHEGEWTRVEASYYLAYYYYSVANDGPKAIETFQLLTDRYPSNPLYAYFLGRSYQINHQPLEALQIYRKCRNIAYEVGAEDIGNWSAFRVGTILQGEHLVEEALREYGRLQKRLNSETHHQEYFYLLPLKIAESLIEAGDIPRAKAYLNVIRPEWDKDTYRTAKDLLRELEKSN